MASLGTQADNVNTQVVHLSGITRIAHAPAEANVDRLYTAGDDYFFRILGTTLASKTDPLMVEDATNALTWIEADANFVVTASEDGCVRLYSHHPTDEHANPLPPTQLHAIVRRESLPVRCAAIERYLPRQQSPRIAVCSDELIVRVVDAGDPRRVQLLTGHARGVRSAAWCPTAPYLITCSSDGSARVWDLGSPEPNCIKVIDGILPAARPESEVACLACWHPSGNHFVIPSKAHELVIMNSHAQSPSWIRSSSYLASASSAVPTPSGSISSMAYSPNGRYLAVGTSDSQITVWEATSKQAIRYKKSEGLVTGISWHPTRDALAWTDNQGTLARWNEVVGSTYPSPCEPVQHDIGRGATAASAAAVQASRGARDSVDDLFAGTGIDDDDDDDVAMAPAAAANGLGPDGDGLDDFVVDDDGRGHYSSRHAGGSGGGHGCRAHRSAPMLVQGTKPQEPFQPTATPMRAQRRYLSFNMVGTVTAVDQETHQTISFESFDVAARRNFRFTDHHGYSMASLGPQGVLFACKRQGESPSGVYFKPFESWNNISSEWTLSLPDNEEVEAIALSSGAEADGDASQSGQGIAVVATSRGYLRFLSTSGMQLYVWALGHPIVSMAAGSRHAFVAYRSAGGALNGHQSLGYCLIDLHNFDVVQEGLVPLAKDVYLRWVGFNDHQLPAVYTSDGVLLLLDRAHRTRQGRWVPLLDTNLLKEQPSTTTTEAAARATSSLSYWPVALSAKQLMVLFLRSGQQYPEVDGTRPLIQELELQLPLVNRESGTGQQEEKSLRDSLLASMARDTRYAGVVSGELEPASLEMASDKALLQLIQLACKADRHSRALDAARRLHSTRTLDAALQIAAFFHLPSLADRLVELRPDLEERAARLDEEARRWCDPSLRGGPAYTSPAATRSRILEDDGIGGAGSVAKRRKLLNDALAGDFAREGSRRSMASSPAPPRRTEPTAPTASTPPPLRSAMSASATTTASLHDDSQLSRPSSPMEKEKTPIARSNPFASSGGATGKTNPFARTKATAAASAGSREGSKNMSKSTSFFDRVDAHTAAAAAGARSEGKKAKQATLSFGSKVDGGSKGKAREAFGETQYEDDGEGEGETDAAGDTLGEESLMATLQKAREEEAQGRRGGLEETMQPQDEESESLLA
ncbi:DNA polymerase alpha accessory factor Mcl1 [Thecaphora frezii]